MLFSILQGGDPREIIINLLLMSPVILISLSVHEAAHGYVAYKLGDRTAYNLGRVTVNPLKHLDPIGSLCMLIFGYGWAKPVPINTRNFRNPKRGMAFTSIAGPISNILLGTFGTILCALFAVLEARYMFISGEQNEFLFNILQVLVQLFFYFGYMNFMLAAFNLIPIPPFDGSRFFSLFMPNRIYFAMMKYERYIMIGVLVCLFGITNLFGFSPFSYVASKLFEVIFNPCAELLENLLL